MAKRGNRFPGRFVCPDIPINWDSPTVKGLGLVSCLKTIPNLGWNTGQTWHDLTRGVNIPNDGTFQNMGGPGSGSGWSPVSAPGGYRSVQFNGTNSKVTASDIGLPAGGASRSVVVWFNNSSASLQALLSYGTASTQEIFSFYFSGGNLYFGGFNSPDIKPSNGVCNGEWHMAVLTYASASTVSTLYIDTLVSGTTTGALNTVTGPGLNFGWAQSPANYMSGYIDGAYIFSTTLTQPQIQAIYADDIAGSPDFLNWYRPKVWSLPPVTPAKPADDFRSKYLTPDLKRSPSLYFQATEDPAIQWGDPPSFVGLFQAHVLARNRGLYLQPANDLNWNEAEVHFTPKSISSVLSRYPSLYFQPANDLNWDEAEVHFISKYNSPFLIQNRSLYLQTAQDLSAPPPVIIPEASLYFVAFYHSPILNRDISILFAPSNSDVPIIEATPATVMRACLIQFGVVSFPTTVPQNPPPCFVSSAPDAPDTIVVLMDRSGGKFYGRRPRTGHKDILPRVQVWVRALDYSGYTLAQYVANTLDENFPIKTQLPEDGSIWYIQNITRMSPITFIGEEVGTKRLIWSFMARMVFQDNNPSVLG
jgi:hypothetical protein